MFVAANSFRIRDVTGCDTDQMHSDHLLDDLKAVGYWDPEKTPVCDWLPAISAGEYNHPYYSLRRIWRVQDRVNPDLGLSPWVQDTYTRDYPFSIRPNRKLTREEIFDLYRDHYEGTEFDLTKGIAAGPYGDPHRFVGPYDGLQNSAGDGRAKAGAWERAISVFYQGYSYVLEHRPEAPAGAVMWFAPDVSYTSVFTPFWAQAAALPASFQTGNPREYDPKTAWWIFDFLGNWARLNWQRMTQVDILPLQKKLERRSAEMVREVQQAASDEADARAMLAQQASENAGAILDEWTALTHKLIAKYSDGYINPPVHDRSNPKDVGYPAHWLAVTDYAQGPTSYDMPVTRRR
jgi:dipeptidase